MSNITFYGRDDLEFWFEEQSHKDVLAVAALSAMRVIPFLSVVMNANILSPRSNILLPLFHALSVANSARDSTAEFASAAIFAADSANFAADSLAFSEMSKPTLFAARSVALSVSTVNFINHAAGCAVNSVYSAVNPDYYGTIWRAISEDARIIASNSNINTPLWHSDPPSWIIEYWLHLRSELLSAEDEDWAVWTDWYEARLRGDPVDIDLERAKALIPDEIWEQGPKVANAEIRRLIDEHAAKKPKRRLPLTIERTRKLIEQDRLGFSFKPAGDHVTLDASDDPADTRIEEDLSMMRMRADQLCRAFAGSNVDYQLDRRDEASMFAEILKRPVGEIAKNARTLWAISMGMGSAYELDAVERARGGSVLTDHQRSATYTFLSSSGPFVRLFPGALEMDSENDRHQGVEHRRTLDLKLIEASVTHRILLQADAGILLAIDGIAKAMTAQSPKAANALDASQTNLIRRILLFAAGKAGLVADATLKGMGIDIAEHLALGEKAISFAISMKDAILSHVETLPADQRAPMKDVIEQLDSMDI